MRKEGDIERAAEKSIPIRFNRETARFENIGADELARWKQAYEKVNVDREIARAVEWAINNPPKKIWRRFLVNWLGNAQKRAAAGGSANAAREMGRNAAADTFGI